MVDLFKGERFELILRPGISASMAAKTRHLLRALDQVLGGLDPLDSLERALLHDAIRRSRGDSPNLPAHITKLIALSPLPSEPKRTQVTALQALSAYEDGKCVWINGLVVSGERAKHWPLDAYMYEVEDV
jgi:hypothetical protein